MPERIASFARPWSSAALAVVALLPLCPAAASAAGPSAEMLADACTSCHGIEGTSKGAIPALAGQDKAALTEKLEAFKAQKGDATIMNRIAVGYTDQDIAALADYFSKVKTR